MPRRSPTTTKAKKKKKNENLQNTKKNSNVPTCPRPECRSGSPRVKGRTSCRPELGRLGERGGRGERGEREKDDERVENSPTLGGGRAARRCQRDQGRKKNDEQSEEKKVSPLFSTPRSLTSPSPPSERGTSRPKADHRSKAVLFWGCWFFLQERETEFERRLSESKKREQAPRARARFLSKLVVRVFSSLSVLRISPPPARVSAPFAPHVPDVGELERPVRRPQGHDGRGRGQQAGEVGEKSGIRRHRHRRRRFL